MTQRGRRRVTPAVRKRPASPRPARTPVDPARVPPAILRYLKECHGRRTAAEIAAGIAPSFPGANLPGSVVARALGHLLEAGAIVQIPHPSGRSFQLGADLGEPPTVHLICQRCGRLGRAPLTSEWEKDLTELPSLRTDGWTVSGVSVSLVGRCPSCLSQEQEVPSQGPP